jgi:hypothetical protein
VSMMCPWFLWRGAWRPGEAIEVFRDNLLSLSLISSRFDAVFVIASVN